MFYFLVHKTIPLLASFETSVNKTQNFKMVVFNYDKNKTVLVCLHSSTCAAVRNQSYTGFSFSASLWRTGGTISQLLSTKERSRKKVEPLD